ncbi:MAG: GFA family protein [Rhodobacterales bacterium]
MLNGSCLCGAVAFTVEGPLRDVTSCHCSQCRKMTGHYWAATGTAIAAVTFSRQEGLKWYRSSDAAERGFCGQCGATLFWKPVAQGRMAISMGSFDQPTGLTATHHIFVADKGDYYDITDGVPQLDGDL